MLNLQTQYLSLRYKTKEDSTRKNRRYSQHRYPPDSDARHAFYRVIEQSYNSVYLCKENGEHVDLFLLGGVDSEAKEKLRELPGERYSRQEIAEKPGKDKLK